MRTQNSESNGRKTGWILAISLAALATSPTAAAALPDESALEMIARQGPPSLPGFVELPSKAALQARKAPSVLVVWFRTKYQPLASPVEMEGRVVISFRFDRETALERIRQGDSYGTWTDLRSDVENFFTELTTEQFQHFLMSLNGAWRIIKMTHHPEGPYDLYVGESRDGKLKGEFSFRSRGTPSSPNTARDGKFPDENVWIRIHRVKG
jgi:hypothetical protein